MSNIAVLSVNHHLATVAIREKVAFAQNELAPAISSLLVIPGIKACVVFSTCNRSEIYVTYDVGNIREIPSEFLATTHGIEHSLLLQYDFKLFYFHKYCDLYITSNCSLQINLLQKL